MIGRRVKEFWAELRQDAIALGCDAWHQARRSWRRTLVGLALTAVLVGLGWRWDVPVSQWIHEHEGFGLKKVAGRIRVWGAFNDTLVLCGVLVASGKWAGRPGWRRAAVAALMAAVVAGIVVNALRVGMGRPRPRANLPDRFTGPALTWQRQSFPSGHSGASFACAGALCAATPVYGALAAVNATIVAAASVLNRSHYPTDVLAGAALGLWIGIGFGRAARRTLGSTEHAHTLRTGSQ